MRRRSFLIFILFALIILSFDIGHAAEVNDGFQEAGRIESRYFTILLEGGVDSHDLAMRIYVPASIRAIIKSPVGLSSSDSLGDQFDMLFLALSEMLDIRLRKFNCKVKVCSNAARLSEITEKLFGRSIEVPGFYVLQINTIYIDAKNIDLNILGHEMCHAIQCNYFVIPPPEKLQEVLSGYVEYQLRKYTGTLPKGR